MATGKIIPPFEVPERAERMATGLVSLGLELLEPYDHGLDPIHAVHSYHYVEFLRTAHVRFQELPNAGPEVFPNVHPQVSAYPDLSPRERPRPSRIFSQAGWYMGDMACALGAETWQAGYASAQSAIAAAKTITAGDDEALALCHPPGHHAYSDCASGFCSLNNAAIAAKELLTRVNRVVSSISAHIMAMALRQFSADARMCLMDQPIPTPANTIHSTWDTLTKQDLMRATNSISTFQFRPAHQTKNSLMQINS